MDQGLRVLALETTGAACSVAFTDGFGVYEHTRIAERRHNALILSMVESVLASAGMIASKLDAIAFSAGPGSFTGVRIGAAVTQGIALGCDVPVIPVATSEVMAEQVRRRNDVRGVVTLRRSRSGWSYLARYRLSEREVECIEFDHLVSDDEPIDIPDDWLLASRPERLQAGVLAQLSMGKARLDAAQAVPFYVEGDSPWKKMSG